MLCSREMLPRHFLNLSILHLVTSSVRCRHNPRAPSPAVRTTWPQPAPSRWLTYAVSKATHVIFLLLNHTSLLTYVRKIINVGWSNFEANIKTKAAVLSRWVFPPLPGTHSSLQRAERLVRLPSAHLLHPRGVKSLAKRRPVFAKVCSSFLLLPPQVQPRPSPPGSTRTSAAAALQQKLEEEGSILTRGDQRWWRRV